MTNILNIAGYKFIQLNDLVELRSRLVDKCLELQVKGTILLSKEGININLAGLPEKITFFIEHLKQDPRFSSMTFRESYSPSVPFKHLRVKIKKEIITLKKADIRPELGEAPAISPAQLKQWLDENRDLTILDTRNDYEVQFGTFQNAVNLHINDFSDFPKAANQVSKDKPIVMFCTGGIRCEKAAWVMLQEGYSEVYQLQGGILNYFKEVGGTHYEGDCFVFDQRIALDSNLQVSGTLQCKVCQGPIKHSESIAQHTHAELSCTTCVNHLT